jgi:acetolactate synthase I/II/III large subunit
LGGTVADAVADELAHAGVDRVFGLPGGEVLHLMDAIRRRGIEYTLCRHESAAGVAASVYGKIKRTTGVAITTLGPGASNLLFPLAGSLLDREPLLAISAQTSRSSGPLHTHQRLPLIDVFAPITKLAASLQPEGCRETVRAAVAAATAQPQGPAYLALAADDAVAAEAGESLTAGKAVDAWVGLDPTTAADELTRRLSEAERPLIIVGLGTRWEVAPVLQRWLASWRLPYGATPKAKGIVNEHDQLFVGTFGGMALDDLMVEAVEASDLLIGFGLDPVEIDKTWHARPSVTWALESPCATGLVPDGSLFMDHLATLELLAANARPRSWVDAFGPMRKGRLSVVARREDSMGPASIVQAAAAGAPPGTVVTADVGSHKYVFGQFWPAGGPGDFWMSNGLSGMGYGLPAALGAKLARPERPVLAVLGDGGFAMTSQELETARRMDAPIVVLVIADRSLSLIRIGQESRGLPNMGVDFGAIDAVKVAEACGADGVRVSSLAEITSSVAKAARSRSSTVIEIPMDPNLYRGLV